MGHSAGGLAAIIADSLLPGRIHRAALAETRVGARPAGMPPGELQQQAQRTRMKRAIWESREAMYQGYRSRSAFKNWAEDAFQEFIDGGTTLLKDHRAQLKCLPDTEAAFYADRASLDVTQYLQPGLQGKYLLLLGDYPGLQTQQDEGVRRFLKLVDNSKVKLMGVGGHFLPMEHPQIVLQEIREFFTD